MLVLGTSWARAASPGATRLPLRYEDNRIMIQCLLNGRGPFTFILDTGSSGDMLIDTAVASSLGLKLRQTATVAGAGNKPVHIFATMLRTFQAGGMMFDPGSVAAADLSEIRRVIGFKRFDGIVGTQIFQVADVEINVDGGYIRISRPHLQAPAGAHMQPLSFYEGLPEIVGAVNGIRGPMILDTGDHSTFTLFNRFLAAHPAFRSHLLQSNVRTGVGLGGLIFGDYLRVASLQIAGFQVRNIVARASRQHGGVFSAQPQVGSIGDGVLRRFNIVFDYRRKRMELWPASTLAHAPKIARTDGSTRVPRERQTRRQTGTLSP